VREIYGLKSGVQISIQDLLDAIEPTDRSKLLSRDASLVTGQNIRFRVKRIDRGVRWVRADIDSVSDPSNVSKALAYTCTLEDITQQVEAHHALIESEERLRLAVEAGKMAIWENDLETGTITPTPELNRMFGFPADAKPSLAELRSRYAPGELERISREGATWESVKGRIASGELRPRVIGEEIDDADRTQVQVEFSIVVPPGITKHLLYRAQYVYSHDGRPKITGFLVDITDKRRAEDQLTIVARELRHRVKNSLAVVQALAYHSFNKEADNTVALQSFLGRIQALSSANDLILNAESGEANISDIVGLITKPYQTANSTPFVLSGPSIRLNSKAASTLSMVLHELCTNALKYGALSCPSGQVHLDWFCSDGDIIKMVWRERGGPLVIPPNRKGFGTRLLDRIVVGSSGGSLQFDFQPSGLVCRVCLGRLL
jgi:two-component sensor histidine kinase